jgi:hypothetical protein
MNQKVDQKLLDEVKKRSSTNTKKFSKLVEKIKGAISDEDAKKILDMLPIDIDPGMAPPKTTRPTGVPRDIDPGMGSTVRRRKEGGLMEATAKLKAKGFSEGGAVVKDKTVAIDKSPNSGLITQRGFGASRKT